MKPRYLLAGAMLAALSTPSYAAFTFTISEAGTNVSLVGTGSIDTSAYGSPSGTFSAFTGIYAQNSFVFAGPAPASSPQGVSYTVRLSGPTLGTGPLTRPTSGLGDLIGLEVGANVIYVPTGYVSGTALNGSSLFVGQSFQSLGLTAGTYSYRDANNVLVATVNVGNAAVAPEPASWAMMIAGFGAVGVAMRRRKVAIRFA